MLYLNLLQRNNNNINHNVTQKTLYRKLLQLHVMYLSRLRPLQAK